LYACGLTSRASSSWRDAIADALKNARCVVVRLAGASVKRVLSGAAA
jgi:hypothetical protein